MIRISNIRMPLDYQSEQLEKKVCKLLRTRSGIQAIHLVKQSVDARKKSDLHFVLSVDVEAEGERELVKGAKSNQIKLVVRKPYQFPPVQRTSTQPPVVVGMGPAGLFAAYIDGERSTGTLPVFGTNANVRIVITTASIG